MFCSTKFGAELIASNPKWFRYDLVWNKMRGVSFLSANVMPMRSHEMVYVFSKKGAYYKRVDIEGDFKKSVAKNPRKTIQGQTLPNKLTDNTGRRCVLSVIESDGYATRQKGQHPTAKPEELYKWLLERYCPEGGTMLDPTAGSFNSCWVAKKMGLKAIGIEKDPVFFWKAVARLD
jgi:site-specific DNA-methyltransferase (adenine-specific)